jgi:hypothetical protein
MKYSVSVDGHAAEVSVEVSGQSFTGTVSSADYGEGSITNGVVAEDGTMIGNVSLEGYVADFSAKVTGPAISGTLKYGWFFSKDFSGTEAA